MTGARRSVAAAVSVSTACVLPPFLVGALAVQVRADLGFGEAALGVAVAVSFGAAAVTSALAGRLVERTGPAFAMRGATLVAAVALAGMSAAPSWGALVAFLGLGGLANSAAQASSNLLLSRSIAHGRQATAFGIKQSAIPAAMLLGGLAVPSVALTVGWRWAFGGAAVLAGAAALLVPPVRSSGGGTRETHHLPRVTAPLVTLAVAGGLGAAAANTLGAFLVASAVETGFSEGSAGLLFALGSAVGLAARVAGGVIADRTSRPEAFAVVSTMLLGGAIGFALLATSTTVLVVPATVIAFGLGWGWPGLFNWSVVTRYRTAPAAATGITQTGVYLGALTGPMAFGFVAQHASYGAAWSLALASAVGAAIAVAAAARGPERSALAAAAVGARN